MTTQTDERVDASTEENTGDDPSKQAHYYDTTRYNVEQARANATPIVALCGYVFVPKIKAPKDRPICPVCLDLALCGYVCKP